MYTHVRRAFCFVFTDLGVVTSTQIQFLRQNVTEKIAVNQLKTMVAIAYDPIKKDIYISDDNQKVGSIFRIKTTGEGAYTTVEPIVASMSNFRYSFVTL